MDDIQTLLERFEDDWEAVARHLHGEAETREQENFQYRQQRRQLRRQVETLEGEVEDLEARLEGAESGDDHVIVAERGANGTAAASHTTSAEIYAASAIDIVRRFVPDANGEPIVPARVEVWATRQGSPRHPGDSNYHVDWIGRQRGNRIKIRFFGF